VTPRNTLTFLAATCLAAQALTACGPGSPEAGRPNTAPPSASGTPSGSTGTTPAPTTTSPTRPPAASGSSLAAGEAFISFYVTLMNHASETGDTGPLLADSDKGCIGCKGIADFSRKVNAKNGGLKGDYKDRLATVKEIYRGADTKKVGGSATIKSGAYEERPSPSAAPVSHTPGTGTMEFTLLLRDGNWVMYEMQINQ